MYIKRQLEKEVNTLTTAIAKKHKPNFRNCENTNPESFGVMKLLMMPYMLTDLDIRKYIEFSLASAGDGGWKKVQAGSDIRTKMMRVRKNVCYLINICGYCSIN
ncbi:hypothetical protein D910_02870, partial [Dendroctonus ponderosae]